MKFKIQGLSFEIKWKTNFDAISLAIKNKKIYVFWLQEWV